MAKDKIEINIYKIDKEKTFSEEDIKSKNLIKILFRKILQEDIKYNYQDTKDNLSDDFEISLLHKKQETKPKWKNFLMDIVSDDSDLLKPCENYNESFIMACLNKKSENLYIITGGSAYHTIQEYIDVDFGIDLLSRMIKRTNKIIKHSKEKNVMGGIIGLDKTFRKAYNLHENEEFGTIYKELKVSIDKKILKDHFGFIEDDLKNEVTCLAKKTFTINKSIGFFQLLKIIEGCEYVSTLDPIIINNIKKIENNKPLISKLNDSIYLKLFEYYRNPTDSIDLCHEDFEKYIKEAALYKVSHLDFDFEKLIELDTLFNKIKEKVGNFENIEKFKNYISKITIKSFANLDENENCLTKGNIMMHLLMEVDCDGKNYFLIDGDWYEMQNNFLEELNNSCNDFIKNENINKLGTEETDKNEDEFNKNFIIESSEKNKFVLHTILEEGIELCDILTWDDENLYIHHVKNEFSGKMRELCSQILISTQRILVDKISNEHKFIRNIYKSIEKKKKSKSDSEYTTNLSKQTEAMTEDEFVKLFSKKLNFVITIIDNKNFSEGVNTSKSNIAKFSLNELIKDMRSINQKLNITFISKISQ